MRKALALTMAAALSLSLLSGCTSTKPDSTSAPSAVPSAAPTAAPAPATASYTYADTVAWDGQYDVVVVGFGGAGAMAAKTAADAGAKVLIVEKAPEGHEGGNTRVCGQLFVYGDEDEEATYQYYKQLAGQHDVPDASLRIYTKEIAHMYDKVSNLFGIDKSEFVDWTGHPAIGPMSPEYPEFTGAEHISLNTLHEGYGDSYLWQQFRKLVTDRADSIDVLFDSPATHLVQDPQSKTILGVTMEREGKSVNIRATNGVVLTTGGFENNPEMVADYLGLTKSNPVGGLYNTGDGITMAMEVGADLWHMEAYEGIGSMGGSAITTPQGTNASRNLTALTKGASIVVAGDGNRFLREDETARHGHIDLGDAWMNVRRPLSSYIICDDAAYQTAKAAQAGGDFTDKAVCIKNASTVKELAALINVDADALTATVERFNSYAKAGYDPEFGRAAANMSPIQEGNLYAIEISANILNTQGGPRRNENSEVIDVRGNPIPHLYSAGELGGITAFQYQGGGNIAECIIFGEIAGKNAAAPKSDALPDYTAVKPVESKLQFTPGKVTDLGGKSTDIALGANEYLGVSTAGMGGDVKVKVTMDGDKIAKVEVVEQSETVGIGDKATSALPDAFVAANSADVDTITGATVTSKALIEAVKDALSQVK